MLPILAAATDTMTGGTGTALIGIIVTAMTGVIAVAIEIDVPDHGTESTAVIGTPVHLPADRVMYEGMNRPHDPGVRILAVDDVTIETKSKQASTLQKICRICTEP